MRRLLTIILSVTLLLGTFPATARAGNNEVSSGTEKEFYVSPDGNDSNAGTKEEPFKTVERARVEVAKFNQNMTADIVVYLMDGVYYQDKSLTFGTGDSGTNGYKVRYEAYQDAKPEISGGKQLAGTWELHDAEKNIYKIPVEEGLNFRQLYVNGEKGIRARTGEPGIFDGSSRIQGADRLDENGNVIPEWWRDQGNAAAKVQAAGGRVIVPADGRISEDMDGLRQIELHIFTAWSENILRIDTMEKIDNYDCQAESQHTGKEVEWDGACYRLKIRNPEAVRIFNRPHPGLDNYVGGPHYAFYYENAYQYIDEDTEWYLDTDKNMLYYKAPADMDMSTASAVAPVLDEVIVLEGTLDNPVHDIVFKGLTVEHSTWLQPSEEGLVGGQACQYVTYGIFANNDIGVKRADAGIRIENAAHIRLDGNHIRFMGATGILLASGTNEVTLINNIVEETAGNGIEAGKFAVDENTDYHTAYNPADLREVCTNDRILNNTIHTVGTQYEGAVGIGAGYVQGITIGNNTIYDCPYSGISVGYGWTSTPNPMKRNNISRNEIYHVNQIVCDGGAIYTLSNQEPDSMLLENYMHDNMLPEGADYGANGIYMDEQTSGYTVMDNVLVNSYGVTQHITGPNNMQTNYTFWGKDTDNGYDAFVTDKVKSVMENAGVQDPYDEEELFKPVLDGADYDPYYGILNLTGRKFGSDAGTVSIETESGTVMLTSDDIKSWSNGEISFVPPQNVASRDMVTVTTKDKITSAAYPVGVLADSVTELLKEDFDGQEEGRLNDSDWSVSVANKASIVSGESGNYLELKGNDPNLNVSKLDQNGTVLAYGNNVTQFDFQFPQEMSGYTGLYNTLRVTDQKTEYTANIRPAYQTKLAIELKGQEEVKDNDKDLETGVWYTCRTMVYENMIYLSVFKKGDTEPDGWGLKKKMADEVKKDCLLNFSFYDPSRL